MAVKIIEGSSFADYSKKVLSTRPKKQDKEKKYPLPAPFNKKDDILEKQVLADIKELLDLKRIWYIRVDAGIKIVTSKAGNSAIPSQMKGFPDLIVGYKGKLYFVEVKRKGGQYDASQETKWMHLTQDGGATVIVATTAQALIWFLEGTLSLDSQVKRQYCTFV